MQAVEPKLKKHYLQTACNLSFFIYKYQYILKCTYFLVKKQIIFTYTHFFFNNSSFFQYYTYLYIKTE